MGLRKKFEQFRQEWKDTPIPQGKPPARKQSGGDCTQRGCGKQVWRDGYCKGCWFAIFGGVA